jgi:hypothetical protein
MAIKKLNVTEEELFIVESTQGKRKRERERQHWFEISVSSSKFNQKEKETSSALRVNSEFTLASFW